SKASAPGTRRLKPRSGRRSTPRPSIVTRPGHYTLPAPSWPPTDNGSTSPLPGNAASERRFALASMNSSPNNSTTENGAPAPGSRFAARTATPPPSPDRPRTGPKFSTPSPTVTKRKRNVRSKLMTPHCRTSSPAREPTSTGSAASNTAATVSSQGSASKIRYGTDHSRSTLPSTTTRVKHSHRQTRSTISTCEPTDAVGRAARVAARSRPSSNVVGLPELLRAGPLLADQPGQFGRPFGDVRIGPLFRVVVDQRFVEDEQAELTQQLALALACLSARRRD